MNMLRVALAVAGVALITAPACKQRKFKIEMQREADGTVSRAITIWTEEDNKVGEADEADRKALAEIYGDGARPDDVRWQFAARFEAELPADVRQDGFANFGRVTTFKTRMGSSTTYVERMPGQTSPILVIENGRKVIDVYVRALTARIREVPELHGRPEQLKKVIDFLDTEFREDVGNVWLMLWMSFAQTAPGDEQAAQKGQQELGARMLALLTERGYISVDQLPRDLNSPMLPGVLRKVATLLGLHPSDPLPPWLAELEQPDTLTAFMKDGLHKIGSSEDEVSALLVSLRGPHETPGGEVDGTVLWRRCHKPVQSNGEWNGDQRELRWKASGAGGLQLPQVLFATWSEPDERYQEKRFGKVVLREHLPEYNTWHRSLRREEARQWDDFVTELEPGDELSAALAKFRFEDADDEKEPDGDAEQAEPSASTLLGAQLILDGLKTAAR